jgi:hypothetical protein
MTKHRPGERDRHSYTQESTVVDDAYGADQHAHEPYHNIGNRPDHKHHGVEKHPHTGKFSGVGPEHEGDRHRTEED